MEIKQLKRNFTDRLEFCKQHLLIVNAFLDDNRMTTKEIEVLAEFMAFDSAYTKNTMFNSYVRKEVREKLGMTAGGIGNHLKALLDKKCLFKNPKTKEISLNPAFKLGNTQGYQFKITLDE